MHISILISTWNNSDRLKTTLDALSRCVVPRNVEWELVLVNNNCTDETDEVVSKFVGILPLVYLRENRQGVSQAKNTGLHAASGELVVFTDDDVKPCSGWLQAHWHAYEKKPVGFYFGGPVESEYEMSGPDEELAYWAPPSVRGLYWGEVERPLCSDRGEYFIGANWSCPRKPILALGGFDITKGLNACQGKIRAGEETDLMRRVQETGWLPWYLPDARVDHFVPVRKCGPKHIGARVEAAAFHYAKDFKEEKKGLVVRGVPCLMFWACFQMWVKWLWAKAKGEKGYREYMGFRRMVGTVKGLHELRVLARKELGEQSRTEPETY